MVYSVEEEKLYDTITKEDYSRKEEIIDPIDYSSKA